MKLEKVQRRAARWALNDYSRFGSVTLMLDQLSWPTLQTRCKLSRLRTLHKVFYQLTVSTYSPFVLLTNNTINETCTVPSTTLYLTLLIYYSIPK